MSDGTAVLIMAAGAGDRFSAAESKTFCPLLGRPMLVWSAERLGLRLELDPIIVVCPPGDEGRAADVLREHGVTRVSRIVAGGRTRQESVRRGLERVDPSCRTVLVHDAARPCLTLLLVDRILEALKVRGAVVPVWPVTDTLVRLAEDELEGVIDRSRAWRAQTPQGFRADLLRRAHEHAMENAISSSDDGSLVLALGESVWSIAGERTNIKVTYAEDAPIAEAILERQRL